MRISVIIPTLNAEKYLPELLGRLQRQTLVPEEIIVVDSNSDDKSVQVAQRLGAKILMVEQSSYDHGGTRNFAASHAAGDVLVYITQDALPAEDDFLKELISPLKDPQVGAAFGRQVVGPNADPLEQMTREFNYPSVSMRKSMATVNEQGIKTFFFSNVCSAIRKDTFQLVGGFPERIIMNEDMIFAARCILQGNAIVYAAEARIIHSHQYTLAQQFRRHFDIGASLRMNEWLLDYAKPEGEGWKLLKKQFRQLSQRKLWQWIPRWFAENLVKYIGYYLGFHYRKLPRPIRASFSMHSYFWRFESEKKVNVIGRPIEDKLTENKLI